MIRPRSQVDHRVRREQRRLSPRDAVVILPTGFTLANLFFGIFAMISASRDSSTLRGS